MPNIVVKANPHVIGTEVRTTLTTSAVIATRIK